MVRLDHVSFGYDKDSPILKDITLCINDASFFGICGRSGSGKTTLAKIICGTIFERPRITHFLPLVSIP